MEGFMKFLVRLSRLRHLCRICAAALLLSGCATTGTMDGGTGESPPKTAGEEVKEPVRPEAGEAETLPAVVAVSVVGDGDALFIETTGSTKHTVFRLTEPPRLVIDMPGVDVSAVDSPMTVDNPYMTEITASSYGEGAGRIGRISIGLRPGVEYEITSGDRSILVSLTGGVEPAAAAEAAAAEAEAVPAGEAVPAEKAVSAKEAAPVAAAGSPPPASRAGFGPAEVVEGAFRKEETAGEAAAADDIPEAAATPGQAAAGPAPAAPADAGPSAPEAGPEPQSPAAPPPAAPPPAPQATTLTAVERTRVGEESVFTIRADGVIGNYNAFSLDDPARIVVDIWGVDSAIGHYRIEYDDPYVKAMRIGRHPDKVRFVFDAGDEGSLPGYIAEKSGEVVTVRFMSPGRAERLKPTSVAAYGPGSAAAATEAEGVPALEAVSAKEAAPVAAAESPPPAPSAGFGPAEVVEGAFKKEETVEEAAASGEPVPAPRVDTGPVVAGFGPG
ncbi:MAG TPA: AMIN domain-containing protein, partial [Deltaproteobacteria bacterium]|nr:AMIN domain-containing protein [Deltaproteobacteria bacterium]